MGLYLFIDFFFFSSAVMRAKTGFGVVIPHYRKARVQKQDSGFKWAKDLYDTGRVSIFQSSDVDRARLCGDWLHLRKLLIPALKCKSRSIIAECHFEYVWMETLVCSITKTKFAAITNDHWRFLMSHGRVAVNSCFFYQMLVKIALIFKNLFLKIIHFHLKLDLKI